MINVNFGAVGITSFNAADFFLQTMIDTVSFEVSEHKIRLYSENEKSYVELRGDFVVNGGKDPHDYIEHLDSYKFVIDGKTNYEVSGLDLDGDTLQSWSKLAEYLNDNRYKVTGNDAANQLGGGSSNDALSGFGGNDMINGKDGDDSLDGGKGNDLVLGGGDEDSLVGGDDNDRLSGGDDEDTLNGGEGNDIIVGDEDDDFLIGGSGRDRFVFRSGDGDDEIKDFEASGKNADTIDLSDFGGKLRFKDIDISRDGKHDVSIEIGKHDEILLHNVNIKELSVSDFDF